MSQVRIFLSARRRGMSLEAMSRLAWLLGAGCYVASLGLDPLDFYVSPVANVSILFVGAAIAVHHVAHGSRGSNARRAEMGLLLLLFIVFMPSSVTGLPLYRYTFFVIGAIAAFVVIDHGASSALITRLLGAPLMATIGRASYSLYLWHIPVLWVVWWGLPALSPWLRTVLAAISLIPVVAASYWLFERPWLRKPPLFTAVRRSGRATHVGQEPRAASST